MSVSQHQQMIYQLLSHIAVKRSTCDFSSTIIYMNHKLKLIIKEWTKLVSHAESQYQQTVYQPITVTHLNHKYQQITNYCHIPQSRQWRVTSQLLSHTPITAVPCDFPTAVTYLNRGSDAWLPSCCHIPQSQQRRVTSQLLSCTEPYNKNTYYLPVTTRRTQTTD